MNKDPIQAAQEQEKRLKLNTKLWFAVENNDLETIKSLIDQGADLYQRTGTILRQYDLDENTPLHIAAKKGHLDIVDYLTSINTNVDILNRLKQTPLQWSAYFGHLNCVKKLIENGADINHIDTDGDTAFTWAASKSQFVVTDYLISLGAEPNKVSPNGNTALHWVAIAGDTKMAEYLIQHGCDPHLQNNLKQKAIDLAIENGHAAMAKLLNEAE